MSGIDFRGLTCANCRDGGEWFFEEGRCLFLLDPLGKGIIHEMKYQGVKDVVGDLPAMIERVPGFMSICKIRYSFQYLCIPSDCGRGGLIKVYGLQTR